MTNTTDRTSVASILTSLHVGNMIDGRKLSNHIRDHVVKAGARYDASCHAAAVAVIHRSMPIVDGGAFDCSAATLLVNGIAMVSRRKALVAWFHAFSNIRLLKDDKSGLYAANLIPSTSKMYAEARPTEAMAQPFWTAEEKSTDPKAFDLNASILALLKRADKADVSGATIDALRKLAVPAA